MDDPFLWLEEVEGSQALDWVKQENERTLSRLQSDECYAIFENEALTILQATDRIAYGRYSEGHVYNFWQDDVHVRGIWRRTDLASYRSTKPDWDILLDVDALAGDEGENWVLKGIDRLQHSSRAIITLSKGGGDASIRREYDFKVKQFVDGGFVLPEAKAGTAWLDCDCLLVATDWGEGSLTQSGYPRIVKNWRRGTPLDEAVLIFEGNESDVGVWPAVIRRPEGVTSMVSQSLSFFTHAYHLIADEGVLQRLPLPDTADFQTIFKRHILFQLKEDWAVQGQIFHAGSVVAFDQQNFAESGICRN